MAKSINGKNHSLYGENFTLTKLTQVFVQLQLYQEEVRERTWLNYDNQDREAREETTRRTSIHDTEKLTSGHSAPDFAHAHQPLKKLIHSSGHSVKKKSRKMSDKAEQLEGIQEKEGRDNPDPPILEEDEESGSKPSSLPWRQAGDEEGTLAMVGSEIPR